MDGNWPALYAASDGKVYAGLAYHGGDGHLGCYDSKTNRMHDVGNLTELCGESHVKRGPQSKIHAKFGEGKDGRIYFGTHAGFWWNYARLGTKEGYPGAHWMAFDPKTGRVEDFGLGVRNEGVNTGAYDPLFNRIYGLTHPRGHFVYYDVATRRSVDKGRVNNFESISRRLGIDDEGNVYGSFGQGQVFRYDPRTDEIEELPVRLPIRPKGISLGRDYLKSETAWRMVVWDRQTRQFFGVEESATILFSFNPRPPDPSPHVGMGAHALFARLPEHLCAEFGRDEEPGSPLQSIEQWLERSNQVSLLGAKQNSQHTGWQQTPLARHDPSRRFIDQDRVCADFPCQYQGFGFPGPENPEQLGDTFPILRGLDPHETETVQENRRKSEAGFFEFSCDSGRNKHFNKQRME